MSDSTVRPPKFSVVIPYKQRLHNISLVLAGLADQDLARAEFEVIVGAMEYDPAYVTAIRACADRLTVTSVLSAEDWNVSRARNLAIRQAEGDVIVILDADMVPPPDMLRTLWDRYFADGQDVCVLGQAVGYDGKNDVASVDALPYEHYRQVLAELGAGEAHQDERWSLGPLPLPWVSCWAGLVALRAETVRVHGLTFDPGFCGWGAEDQEWGYRVDASGTPFVLGDGIWALHLPHSRDSTANYRDFTTNRRYFLAKWPTLGVEMFQAFGWIDGNRMYEDARRDLASVAAPGHTLGAVLGRADGAGLLVIGATLDPDLVPDAATRQMFDETGPAEALPLIGLALPYPDGSIHECRVLPAIDALPPVYRDAVLREAARVAIRVERSVLTGPAR